MLDRSEAVERIRNALYRRTGSRWSVTVGRGTTWGWITVRSPKARRVDGFEIPEAEARHLALIFPSNGLIHAQGISIPPSERDRYVREAENLKTEG